MSNEHNIYEFDDFSIDLNEKKLFKLGEQVPLKPKAFRLLMLLVENAGSVVTNEESLNIIWAETFVEEGVIHKRITEIRKALNETAENKFIETGVKGYKFIKPVERKTINKSLINNVIDEHPSDAYEDIPEVPDASSAADEDNGQQIKTWQIVTGIFGVAYAFSLTFLGINFNVCLGECYFQKLYILIGAVAFGLLLGSCLILESAYQFDKYGWKPLYFSPIVFLINFSSIYAGLNIAGSYPGQTGLGFGYSSLCLLLGCAFSCLIASFVLPNTRVTIARIGTHPATSAFYKNVFMYSLPLYLIFCLLIFCLMYLENEYAKLIWFPIGFFIIWLLFVFVSFFSTMYLLNNLLREKKGISYPYHGLFVSLIFLRFVLFFGPTFTFILWYFLVNLSYLNKVQGR